MMQNHNDNPYSVTVLIDDEVIEPERVPPPFWVRAAKFCALLPILYVPVDWIGWSLGDFFPGYDQYVIFFVGTWVYALISIPAVIGINFLHSRVGLFYGIVINIMFAMFALMWLIILGEEAAFPPLFGLPVELTRIFYVVMYVGTIYVFLKAWRPLGEEY